MTDFERITRQRIAEEQRCTVTADHFGVHFPLQLEPSIFALAANLSSDYVGGYWDFYTLDNGGFYMAPDSGPRFQVISPNGYEGFMSADAFGIAVCLFTFSHLSFSNREEFANACARHYHWLREFAMDHAEAGAILAACD